MSDGKIIYDVDINDSGIESKLNSTNNKIKNGSESGSKASEDIWTGALRRIGAGLVELGAKAADTAKQVAMDALHEVSSLEQNVGGVKKLFGDDFQAVVDNANKAFKTAGMSSNQYMETVTSFSASLITSLGNDTKKAVDYADRAIRDMSDNSNVFGTDLQSIQVAYAGFAKGNYTLLDNLKLGFGGTKEEMARLVAEAATMDKEMQDLGVTVDADSLSFDNIVNAISVTQAHMEIMGTTATEAAGTIEGSVNSAKAAWKNFLAGTISGEEFAQVALNAVDNVVGAFMTIVPRLISGFGSMMPAFLERGRALMDSVSKGLVNGIPNFLAKALPMIQDFTANLRQNAGKFIDEGIEFIKNLMQGLMNSLPTLIQYLPTIISNICGVINDNMPKILKLGLDLLLMLLKGIVQAVPTLIAEFPKILRMIFDIWQAADWLGVGRTVINAIGNGIRNLAHSIPNALIDIINTSIRAFANASWGSVGRNIVSGIANGIWDGASRIIDAAKDVARQALNAAKSFLGIHSPSRKFRDEVGLQVDAGEAQGIIENADMVEDAAAEVAERALDASMNVNYNLPDTNSVSQDIGASFTSRAIQTVNRLIEVPLSINGREIARATAWDMGEQLAWESR